MRKTRLIGIRWLLDAPSMQTRNRHRSSCQISVPLLPGKSSFLKSSPRVIWAGSEPCSRDPGEVRSVAEGLQGQKCRVTTHLPWVEFPPSSSHLPGPAEGSIVVNQVASSSKSHQPFKSPHPSGNSPTTHPPWSYKGEVRPFPVAWHLVP